MNSSSLVIHQYPTPAEYQTMKDLSVDVVNSRLLPSHIKSAEQAFFIMLKARELRIPPTTALAQIYLVEGKLTLAADIMAGLVYRAIDERGGGEFTVLESTDKACTVQYMRWGQSERRTYTYTWDDAVRAGHNSKATYKQNPTSMLRARAIGHVCRFAFADICAGMYTPEEIEREEPKPQTYARIVNLETGEITETDATAAFDTAHNDIKAAAAALTPPAPGIIQEAEVKDIDPKAASKAKKQEVWTRAGQIWGENGERTRALDTLLRLEAEGAELTTMTNDQADTLLSVMEDPEGVREYVAMMADRPDEDEVNDDLADWAQKVTTTPVNKWSELWDDAFSSPDMLHMMLTLAPSVGALRLVRTTGQKNDGYGWLESDEAIYQEQLQLRNQQQRDAIAQGAA